MNRQFRRVTRLAATTLLVGVAVLACSKPTGTGSSQPAGSTLTALQSQTDQAAATLVLAPSDAATGSAAAAASPSAATTAAGAAAGDPLDTQLSNLDDLLNGVNGSLSGSDASAGE